MNYSGILKKLNLTERTTKASKKVENALNTSFELAGEEHKAQTNPAVQEQDQNESIAKTA